MALPHMPTTYTTRRNIYEAAMVHRRTRETDFYDRWGNTATYFNKENVAADTKNKWESNKSFQTSMDAYKNQQEREIKTINLKKRRLKLGEMLRVEREVFQRELEGISPRPGSARVTVDEMKERSETLRSAREDRRKQVADQLLVEHFRQNNPDLRQLEQKQHEQHVISEWSVQEEEKKKNAAEEERLKAELELELVEKDMRELELQRQREQEKVEEEMALKQVLKGQMGELKQREREATALKKQEDLLMSEQWELDQLEEQRRATERDRSKLQFGRVLLRQHAAALRRRSQQVQKELEEDLKLLQKLSAQEEEDRLIQTARREKEQTDARWMRQVVSDQLRVEQTREAELDMLYQDEAARMWEQRETEWARERAARQRLMNEVLEGRQEQILDKLDVVKQQQAESIERREEILRDLELANQLTRREEREKEEQKTERKAEIEAQVTSRKDQEFKFRRHLEDELLAEKQEEDEYDDFLHKEAGRMSERGYQPKQHGRKQAWM